ncbi:hypothetical protein LCGC14_1319460 [marine sediment metagenome]|uniref:Uncharacterized protein n=1 Tax=marine sediment metagenome TaxID=412755 RepID=A0A0F9KJZ0_9ZZZZ
MAIIAYFRHVLDFYYWKGIPCVRTWPKSPRGVRSPAVQAQWGAFATASRLWIQMSQEVQDTYTRLSAGTGLSGRDMFTRAYITGLYRYPTP